MVYRHQICVHKIGGDTNSGATIYEKIRKRSMNDTLGECLSLKFLSFNWKSEDPVRAAKSRKSVSSSTALRREVEEETRLQSIQISSGLRKEWGKQDLKLCATSPGCRTRYGT